MSTSYSRQAFELAARKVIAFTYGDACGADALFAEQRIIWATELAGLLDAAHTEALQINAELATCSECGGRLDAEGNCEEGEDYIEALQIDAELATCTDCEQGTSHDAPCTADAAKVAAVLALTPARSNTVVDSPIRVNLTKSTPTSYCSGNAEPKPFNRAAILRFRANSLEALHIAVMLQTV